MQRQTLIQFISQNSARAGLLLIFRKSSADGSSGFLAQRQTLTFLHSQIQRKVKFTVTISMNSVILVTLFILLPQKTQRKKSGYGTFLVKLILFMWNLRFSRRWLWRVASSGMLLRVALVIIDVSEELSASFIRVTRIGELGTTLTVTSNRRTQRALFLVHRFLSLWWRRL
jgi:hypothetical protein